MVMAGYRIDGHAHACGEYLNGEKIKSMLVEAGVDGVLLSPGEYMSKTTYAMNNQAKKEPYADVVSKNNSKVTWLVSITGMYREIPVGNEYVFELKQKYPEMIKQCYWVTNMNQDVLEEDYQRMKFDMVKLHQCWEKFDIEDDYFLEVAGWAEEKQIPLFIHVKNKAQMDKLINYIKNHPKLKVVIGHLYLVEEFFKFDKDIFKNTYFDLSNLYYVSKERTKLAYEHFGAKHLLLGSDTPYGHFALRDTVKQIQELGLSEEETDLILGLNLVKIMKHD